MTQWIMNTEKSDDGPLRVHIGELAIAEIWFIRKIGTKWQVELRSFRKDSIHDSVSSAFKELHRQLKSPGPGKVGRLFPSDGKVPAHDPH